MVSSSVSSTSGLDHLRKRGWVSLRQFAVLIGVSYPTALKMRARDQVIAQRVGSVWRVYTTEVRRFMQEGNANQPSSLAKLAERTGRSTPRMSVEGEGDPALSPYHNPHLKPTQEEE